MIGVLVDHTYEYPERKSSNGSTAYSYLTGKTLERTIKVPHKELNVWHKNGELYQEFKDNVLSIFDINGNDSCIYYFDRKLKIDSTIHFFGNGNVSYKTFGSEYHIDNSISVSYQYSAYIIVRDPIFNRKETFYPSGELESVWNYSKKGSSPRERYTIEFYQKNGKISTNLFQTNDKRLTGRQISYYHSGQIKSIETLFRDKKKGHYELYSPSGQLIELSSINDRKIDSIKVCWYENGQMKSWGDDKLFVECYKNGQLKSENVVRRGLNVTYHINGEISNLNHFRRINTDEGVSYIQNIGGRDTNGYRHGEWIGYYNDSIIAYSAEFNNGKQEGLFKVYMPNGVLKYFYTFKDGDLNGEYSYFNAEGIITESGFYRNNRLEGIVKKYDSNEKVYQKEVYSPTAGRYILIQEHDSVVYIQSIVDSLKKVVTTHSYREGVIVKSISKGFDGKWISEKTYYHPNGQLKHSREYFYEAKKQLVPYTHHLEIYDSIGNVIGIKDSVAEKIPVIEKRFSYQGQLESESSHDFKGKDNLFILYHRNGKMKQRSIGNHNNQKNTEEYFDKNGKLERKLFYDGDELIKTIDKREDQW